MNDPRVYDWGLLAIAMFAPILLIWRYRQLSFWLGVVASWGTLAAAGPILTAVDPAREGAVIDSNWLLFGWVATSAYCCLIYAGSWLVRRAIRHRRAPCTDKGDGL